MTLEYLPPRTSREVTIDGYAVPLVEARENKEGTEVHLCLDGRFGAVIPADLAHSVIWLIANALAIGEGFSCHGESSQPINRHKVKVMEVETSHG